MQTGKSEETMPVSEGDTNAVTFRGLCNHCGG